MQELAERAVSRQLAGLIGPGLLAVSATEALNMGIYVAQTAPVVYLNGTILFVAGLAIVRAHNCWQKGWILLVTLTGWVALGLGMLRMVFPTASQAGEGWATYLMLAILFIAGMILSIAAYRPVLPMPPHQHDGS